MKDYSVKHKKYEFDFDGGVVSVEIRPLTVPGVLAIAPTIEKIHDLDKNDPEMVRKMGVEVLHLVGRESEMLGEHIGAIEGITIDGSPATWATMASETVFLSLTTQIVLALFTTQKIGEEDVKNSQGESTGTDESSESQSQDSPS